MCSLHDFAQLLYKTVEIHHNTWPCARMIRTNREYTIHSPSFIFCLIIMKHADLGKKRRYDEQLINDKDLE